MLLPKGANLLHCDAAGRCPRPAINLRLGNLRARLEMAPWPSTCTSLSRGEFPTERKIRFRRSSW